MSKTPLLTEKCAEPGRQVYVPSHCGFKQAPAPRAGNPDLFQSYLLGQTQRGCCGAEQRHDRPTLWKGRDKPIAFLFGLGVPETFAVSHPPSTSEAGESFSKRELQGRVRQGCHGGGSRCLLPQATNTGSM